MEPKHQVVTGLGSCPAEILYLIFKLLSPPELHALCLVNKKFHTIVEPLLYSKIKMAWRKTRPHAPPPITQLLRTILSRPQLAAYITNIHLDGDTYLLVEKFRWTIPKVPVSDAELDQLIIFIRGTGVPYSDLWIQELRQGTIDAFVALLLAQLSNLKYLYLAGDFTRQTALIGMVLRSAICEPGNSSLSDFRHLQDVSFLCPNGEDEARDQKIKNTTDILPFLYLPSVQRMSASVENPIEFTWPAAHLPVPSKLISLDLTTVRETYLGKLLAVTQNVEALRWQWYYDYGVRDRFTTPIVDLDRFTAAISHVRGTLTDLTVSADVDIGGNDQFLPGIKIQGSLHAMVNFDMLKRLQVPWPFLVGFAQGTTERWQDLMPRNIEFLVITDDLRYQNADLMAPEWPQWEWEHSTILGVLQTWLKDWKAYTPHLCRISLVISLLDDEPDDWRPRLRHQLRELSAQGGVELELIDLTD
ncbi:hypothetical protein BDV38DRAFT_293903 [Aspergillus pseudotamarii]|uniref:F-box domain-containing protein n=1 Tax=Aspergillus pseudotamarii TaxID=132259 RepID=A0A5N6SRD6_ASPPS|nr:uncharacterized protein BDV38DRAFT_293903 [Aspergillus pseudotamarii]KAE8136487.1 hypothetical protein BDV38DRAFT_293903 [Aspergillus pseudotamarii]